MVSCSGKYFEIDDVELIITQIASEGIQASSSHLIGASAAGASGCISVPTTISVLGETPKNELDKKQTRS